MSRKMTKEEFRQLKMNRFIAENASLSYNEKTGTATAVVYFGDEKVENALKRGYGFQED